MFGSFALNSRSTLRTASPAFHRTSACSATTRRGEVAWQFLTERYWHPKGAAVQELQSLSIGGLAALLTCFPLSKRCDRAAAQPGGGSIHITGLMVPEERYENDNRQWHSNKPQQGSASKSHVYLLLYQARK